MFFQWQGGYLNSPGGVKGQLCAGDAFDHGKGMAVDAFAANNGAVEFISHVGQGGGPGVVGA